MTKRQHAKILISYSLAFCSAITLTACSFSDVSYFFKNSEEKQALMHESPGFWEDTTPVEGSSNLSILHNVAFEGHPYNDIRQFGDNILMVGQGSYNNSLIESDGQTIEYSFDVYDPWANDIVATLDHDETNCDDYLIKDDNLWLIDSSLGKATIYDSKLEQIDTQKYTPEDDSDSDSSDTSAQNNAGSDDDSSNSLIPNPGNYYDMSQLYTSDDGKYALVSGVSPETYRYEVSSIDLSSDTITSTYEGVSYSLCNVDSDGFVIETDVSNNIWNYHSVDGSDNFFQLADVTDIDMADDGSMLMRLQKMPDSNTSEDQYITYYKYSPISGVSSSFSYDLGLYGSEDFTFCSANSVYLSDADCMMLLLYTAQCNPEILVWSLADGKNDCNAEIILYSDSDTLTQELRDNGTYVSPYAALDHDDNSSDIDNDSDNSNPSENTNDYGNYGDTVTMISDPQSYDWGDLTDINTRADALEQQYGISIYIGEEVPRRIDYYNIKQMKNPEILSSAFDTLEQVLTCFPDGFFKQLNYGDVRGLRIYLSGTISSDNSDMINEPSGFVNVINSHEIMVLDCNYSWDWGYTIAHEMSHLIDQKLDFMHNYNENIQFSESKWSSFNPDSFSYDDTYSNYDPDDSSNWQTKYFIDSYGTTYATEDRAEIFGTAVDNYLNGVTDDTRFSSDKPIHDKLDYYCKCIRDGFDTTGWADVMPWEATLN